jgi:hypothetical protein
LALSMCVHLFRHMPESSVSLSVVLNAPAIKMMMRRRRRRERLTRKASAQSKTDPRWRRRRKRRRKRRRRRQWERKFTTIPMLLLNLSRRANTGMTHCIYRYQYRLGMVLKGQTTTV